MSNNALFKKPWILLVITTCLTLGPCYSYATSPQPLPDSLGASLDLYGFKTDEQKNALRYLMKQAGIKNADHLLDTKTTKPDLLAAKFKDFVQSTQEHFTIRSGHTERWHVEAADWMKNKDTQAKILDSLKILNLVDAVEPKFATTDAICVFGATKNVMKLRLDFAAKLYNANKLTAKKLILLGGERYITIDDHGWSIDGTKQELSQLAASINKNIANLTENDLMLILYKESLFFNKLPTIAINTPKRDLPRPTTETTIQELIQWLKTHPEIQSCTFISSQPYVKYQKKILESILEREMANLKTDVIGPKYEVSNTKDISVHIKNLVTALGSQIYVETPSIMTQLGLKPNDPELRRQLQLLYDKQPLVFKNGKSLFD